MEPAEIVNVLARASELQANIDGAIRRASLSHSPLAAHQTHTYQQQDDKEAEVEEDEGFHGSSQKPFPPHVLKLAAIREALIDLQDQLECLQALQKKQKFEREDLLVELEEKRKLLIKRLRDYDGTEWEIVQEACAFVGEPVPREDDLVLPPYQSSLRDVPGFETSSFNGALSKHAGRQSSSRRASLVSRPLGNMEGDANHLNHPLQEACQSPQEDRSNIKAKPFPFSGFVFSLARLATKAGEVVRHSAKGALLVASVIFAVSQLEPQLRKLSIERVSKMRSPGERSRQQLSSSSASSDIIIQDTFCPAGKVLLVQNGIQKCFVKERVEAPFEEVIRQPDASYGYG